MTNPPNIRTTVTNRAAGVMGYSIESGVTGNSIAGEVTNIRTTITNRACGVTGYSIAGEVT